MERASATQGLLTERTVQPARHVAAQAPGDLRSLDTFYVGKLKGVGKVWQITGCDVASSFAWAHLVLGEVTAAAVLAFLRDIVRPGYRRAGWRLKRVLTDNGKGFKGVFAVGCDRLHIRVTRTKPRHAWTNGFVERLQKTILHEHWRIAFRRQYFTGRRALQGSLDRFCSSTTTNARIAGIVSTAAHPSRSSPARWPRDLVGESVNTFAKLDTLDPTILLLFMRRRPRILADASRFSLKGSTSV
jgi:hypothetical protein